MSDYDTRHRKSTTSTVCRSDDTIPSSTLSSSVISYSPTSSASFETRPASSSSASTSQSSSSATRSGRSRSNGPYRSARRSERQMCPICLRSEARLPVETNCGHLFCGTCIIQYWRFGDFLNAMPCPFCRQSVSVLLTCFRTDLITRAAAVAASAAATSANQTNSIDSDNTAQSHQHRLPINSSVNSDESPDEELSVAQLVHDINDYNRRFSDNRPWIDYVRDLPILLRHLSVEFFAGGLVHFFRIRIVLCLISGFMYLVSPLDVIPEAIYGLFGFLDDLLVLLAIAVYLTVVYRGVLAGRWADEAY